MEPVLHTVWLVTAATVGVGLTVMVKSTGLPIHVLAVGVTVTVPVMVAEVVFDADQEAIFPEPDDASPIDVVLLVQLKEVPDTEAANVTPLVVAVLQYVCGLTAVTVGVGYTPIVNDCDDPVQEFATGVTETVPVFRAFVEFAPVKDAMFPLPEEARPIEDKLLVQLYVVPLTAPVKATAAVLNVLHTVWLVIAATVGVGFTVTVKLCELPIQEFAAGVTVTVPAIVADVVFDALQEAMLPLPEDASPMAELLFDQV